MSRWRIGHSAVRPYEDPDRVYRTEDGGGGLSEPAKKRGRRRGRNGFTAGAAKRKAAGKKAPRRETRNGFTAGTRRRGR